MPATDEYQNTAVIYELLFSRALRSIRHDIHTFFNNNQAKDILDLCCGTGGQLQVLLKKDRRLSGVDLSPAMLTQARKTSPDSILYIESDASKLPQLSSSTYDGIVISLALHEKDTALRGAIFREACRLISPSGHIIIADYSMPPSERISRIVGSLLIPAIERLAGINHYQNYKDWIKNGGIKGFLQKENLGTYDLIASHFYGCINLLSVSKVPQ